VAIIQQERSIVSAVSHRVNIVAATHELADDGDLAVLRNEFMV
jgi:hypothetical protein